EWSDRAGTSDCANRASSYGQNVSAVFTCIPGNVRDAAAGRPGVVAFRNCDETLVRRNSEERTDSAPGRAGVIVPNIFVKARATNIADRGAATTQRPRIGAGKPHLRLTAVVIVRPGISAGDAHCYALLRGVRKEVIHLGVFHRRDEIGAVVS